MVCCLRVDFLVVVLVGYFVCLLFVLLVLLTCCAFACGLVLCCWGFVCFGVSLFCFLGVWSNMVLFVVLDLLFVLFGWLL